MVYFFCWFVCVSFCVVVFRQWTVNSLSIYFSIFYLYMFYGNRLRCKQRHFRNTILTMFFFWVAKSKCTSERKRHNEIRKNHKGIIIKKMGRQIDSIPSSISLLLFVTFRHTVSRRNRFSCIMILSKGIFHYLWMTAFWWLCMSMHQQELGIKKNKILKW